MKFKFKREDLQGALQIIKPVTEVFDLQSISDSLYFDIATNIASIFATNNRVFSVARIPVHSKHIIEFVVDARTIIHIVNNNTVNVLEFELSGTNIAEGEGTLKVKGNATSILPLKSITAFPTFPDFRSVSYQDINIKELVAVLTLSSRFVKKNSLKYNSGICITGNTIIATDGPHALFYKYDLPILPCTIPIDAINPISFLEKVSVAQIESGLLAFKGRIGTAEAFVGINTLEEEFPYDLILSYVGKWLKSKSKKIVIEKESVVGVINRLRGFSSNLTGKIDVRLSNNSLTLSGMFGQNETTETVSCEYEGESVEFGVPLKYWIDVFDVTGKIIEFILLEESPVIIVTEGKVLYSASTYQ